MILSDKRILEEIAKGTIKIEPYDRECLGSNSYDVHLGKHLARYVNKELDAKKHNTIEHFDIPEEGIGIRLENDIMVAEEPVDLMAAIPVEPDEIERLMRG